MLRDVTNMDLTGGGPKTFSQSFQPETPAHVYPCRLLNNRDRSVRRAATRLGHALLVDDRTGRAILAQAEQLVVPRVQPHAQAAGQCCCLCLLCQGIAGQEQLCVKAHCSR